MQQNGLYLYFKFTTQVLSLKNTYSMYSNQIAGGTGGQGKEGQKRYVSLESGVYLDIECAKHIHGPFKIAIDLYM